MTMRLDLVTNDAGELVRREHARDAGASVVIAIYRLVKLAQMHDLSNQAFQRQLEQTTAQVHDYCLRSGSNVNVLFAQKAVFVAGQLMKGNRAVYDQAIELGDILEWCGGSELVVVRDVTQEEMFAFGEAISHATKTERGRFRSPTPKIRLRHVNERARLRGLEVENLGFEQRIIRTYASAVVIMRRFYEDLHASRYVLPRRIKRISQSLVDLSEGATAAFLGVTEARNANYDDAGRAVNTAILAVAMAREITEDRVTLAQVAMAAMMHDVGRPRAQAVGAVPGMPQMPGVMLLSEEQEDRLAGGTAAVLTALGRVNEPSITRTVLAFEALWIRRQQWIGPVYRGARPATLHAKIIAIARRYNDLMTPEPGLAPPTADFVIATLGEELREPSDKTVLRMLVAALGLVPVGTVVQLSTGEIAEVVPRPPNEAGPPDRPRVRVAVDAHGGVVTSLVELDLAREPQRRIARVMSVEGWRKGLDTHHVEATSSPSSPSAQSASEQRETSSPSRSQVAPRSGPHSVPRGSDSPQPTSSPSVSSISSAASVPSIGSSPSSVAGAMGKTINERLKTGSSLPPAAPVSVRPKAPDDARTVLQASPFDTDEKVASKRAPIVHQAPTPRPEESLEPTAHGSLETTPLAHVLVYMLDHALTGSVLFNAPGGDHLVYFLNGVPAKARLSLEAVLIGEQLAAMGALRRDKVDDIATAAQGLEVLYGEYCVGHSLVTRAVLAQALEHQLIGKIASLANLPPETDYAYFKDSNLLETWGGGELTLTGPLNAILAAVRVWHDRARVRATLQRIGKHPLVFHEEADLETLRPTEIEQNVVDAIVTKQCSLPQLFEMRVADDDSVSSVVYALTVTRQLAFKGQKKGPMAARPRSMPEQAARAPISLRPVARARRSSQPHTGVANARSSAPPASYAAVARPLSAPPEGVDVEIDLDSRARPRTAPKAAEPEQSNAFDDAERALEAMTNFRLAETALQRGDMQLAERLAQKAAEGDPSQGEYIALYAWVCAMGATPNKVNDAIDALSGVLRDDPSCERALLYRGKLYKRANKTTEALRDFETVLKANPKHREAASEVRLLRMHSK
jgi:tetratricopeptide (TPR) repeat protein/HD-GYP domain-containing protein (c-di-GMP phosphodiesterase class II)